MLGCISLAALNAQVGINTETPKATLHLIPNKTDGTTAEGIIAPNLSRAQLISKDARYGTDQRGAIVYVTTIDGTVSTKTAKVTTPGYFYFDGSLWQPFTSAPAAIPAEPWFVQGGTTQATGNAQNIYQTGSVSIGSNSAGAYKFQVTGSSNITGNSRVGSSTVVGNEQVSGALGVSGATTLASTLNVAGATAIASTGSFTLAGNGAAAGKYLVSDAAGKGTWTTLPAFPTIPTEPWMVQGGTTQATTNAQNIYQTGSVSIGSNSAGAYKFQVTGSSNITGNSRVGSSTVVGNEQVSGALGVSGATTLASTLNVAGATTIASTGSFTLAGNGAAAGKYLVSDAAGKGTWTTLPAYPTIPSEPWMVQGGTTQATTNAQNIYQTGSIGIGSSAAVPAAYKLQVTGASNITGNSRVASSTVVGNETIGGTLGVTGVANMGNNLIVTGNTGLGISAPTQKLHVVGNEYVTGVSKVGGSATLNASAQLELGDTNKGLLPNRVALTNAKLKAPVTNAVDGMIVYNTANVPGQLTPGFHYWRTDSWIRLVDVIPETTINLLNLKTGATSNAGDITTLGATGTVLPFGDLKPGGTYVITLPEDGSFAFNFRLYGRVFENDGVTNVKVARTIVYYIGLLKNSVLSDAAEINVNVIPTANLNTVATYSVILACEGKKGDQITFRLHHYTNSRYPWSLQAVDNKAAANRTSMVWWKL